MTQQDRMAAPTASAIPDREEIVGVLREAIAAYGPWTGKTCKQECADDAIRSLLAKLEGKS